MTEQTQTQQLILSDATAHDIALQLMALLHQQEFIYQQVRTVGGEEVIIFQSVTKLAPEKSRMSNLPVYLVNFERTKLVLHSKLSLPDYFKEGDTFTFSEDSVEIRSVEDDRKTVLMLPHCFSLRQLEQRGAS